MCVEFKNLRRSGRLAPAKRPYEKMQGTSSSTGRPVKKPKLAVNSLVTNVLPTNGTSEEPATDGSTSEPHSETSVETPANPTATGKSATSEPTIAKSYIENPNTGETPKSFGATDLSSSATHIQIEGGEIMGALLEGDMFQMTLGDGLTILDEYFGEPNISSGSVNVAKELDKWPTFMAESIYQDEALEPAARSNSPGPPTKARHPPNAGINGSSSEGLDVFDLSR